MRANYLKIISIILIVSIFSTGCWDAEEIQKHSIITALVVDYKDDQYSFCAETASILGGGGATEGNDLSFSMVTAQGKNFTEARDALERSTNLPIFLSGIRVAIFTENLCVTGIQEYMNRIRGEFDYRKSLLIATTLEEPEKLIQNEPENVSSVGAAIENVMRTMVRLGSSFEISTGEILEYLAVDNVGFLIPQINLVNEQFTITGYCVMKNGKCAGHFSAEERYGTMFLKLKKKKFQHDINHEDENNIVLTVELSKRKIKPKIINGEIIFDINLSFKGSILYAEKINKLSKKEMKQLEEKVKQEFLEKTIRALDMAQNKFKCDYLDFYKFFRAKYQKQFKQIENWNEAFSKAKSRIKIDFKIVGTSMPSFEKD